MNDFDAMEAINKVLEEYWANNIFMPDAINQIARISGLNHFEHEAARPQ